MSITSIPNEWLLKEGKLVIYKSLAQRATETEPCTTKNKQADFVNLRKISTKGICRELVRQKGSRNAQFACFCKNKKQRMSSNFSPYLFQANLPRGNPPLPMTYYRFVIYNF